MNQLEKNLMEALMTEARILDANIELAEKYYYEIRKIYKTIYDELASLRAQKKTLIKTAESLTDLP